MSYFTIDVEINDLLFKDLNIQKTGELVGACFVTFVATVIFEALKTLKLYLSLRQSVNPLAEVQHLRNQDISETAGPTSALDDVPLLSSLRFPATIQQIRTTKIVFHVLNTLSHTLNVFYGYLIMLLVMSFNVWLTIAVIIGFATGYFIFGALGQMLQLKYKPLQVSHMTVSSDDHHYLPPANTVQTGAGHL